MAPNPRLSKACKVMGLLGIPSDVVKTVLKKLVKVYDNNWDFIEEEDYRVLTDAIFDGKQEQKENLEAPTKKKVHRQHDDSGGLAYQPISKRLRGSQTLGDSRTMLGEVHATRDIDEAAISEVCKVLMADELRPHQATSQNSFSGRTPDEPQISDEGSQPYQLSAYELEHTPIAVVSPALSIQSFEVGPRRVVCSVDMLRGSRNLELVPLSEPDPIDVVVVSNGKMKMLELEHSVTSEKDAGKRYKLSSKGEPSQTSVMLDSGTSVNHDKCRSCDMRQFDLVSSSDGEIKVSLLIKSDFGVPNVESALKDAGVRLSEKYQIAESVFCVIDVFRELCNCLLKLKSEHVDNMEVSVPNVAPDNEISNSSCGNFGGLNVDQQNAFVLVPEISKCLNVLDGLRPPQSERSKMVHGDKYNSCEMNETMEMLKGQDLPSTTLVGPPEAYQSTLTVWKYVVDDVTRGEENLKVPIVNETSLEPVHPIFKYIPHNMISGNANVSFSFSRIPAGDCCSLCYGNCLQSGSPCACSYKNGGEFAYTLDGLLKEKFLDECISLIEGSGEHRLSYCKVCPLYRSEGGDISYLCEGHSVKKFIRECWYKCGCSRHCGNRVVQRGITVNLQVFWTPDGKGWGLRALEELPRGSFVCEYVGEIMTIMELYDRKLQKSDREACMCPVLLDADWGSKCILKDEQALCLDATYFANVARFINHRCSDSNLVAIPVEVENPDHHYYHLAFFTKRKLDALEELTWDYGIEFDDQNQLIEAFKCHCGSQFCRDMKQPRSKSLILHCQTNRAAELV
ncbi:hypothetical protein Dimus_000923 [Dionaea muscipula]